MESGLQIEESSTSIVLDKTAHPDPDGRMWSRVIVAVQILPLLWRRKCLVVVDCEEGW